MSAEVPADILYAKLKQAFDVLLDLALKMELYDTLGCANFEDSLEDAIG